LLLVKTKLDKSLNHGIGCFAAQFIKKGTKVWEFHPEVDRKYTEKDLRTFQNLSEPFAELVRFYGFTENDNGEVVYIFCTDHGKHINHSFQNNLTPDFENDCDYANRDIKDGEELTANYYEYYVDPNVGLKKSL
jgi:SET domain-containing protein